MQSTMPTIGTSPTETAELLDTGAVLTAQAPERNYEQPATKKGEPMLALS
jgi:hypothetical protein